jgi:hypothetical protein
MDASLAPAFVALFGFWPGTVPLVLSACGGLFAFLIVVKVARVRRREEIDRKLILKLDAFAKHMQIGTRVTELRHRQAERLVG